MPRPILPFVKNPFKDGKGEKEIDGPESEKEVLTRYDAALRALVLRGVRLARGKPYTLLPREFTEEDIGRNMQTSVLDFAVSHALQGPKYIEEVQVYIQYTVLQAALILTITVPLFINPPDFGTDEVTGHVFSAIVGFSACCHLSCIISCTILNATLGSTYTDVDAVVARIEAYTLFAGTNVFNYLAIITTCASMVIAGFGQVKLHGWIMLAYCLVMVVVLVKALLSSAWKMTKFQDNR